MIGAIMAVSVIITIARSLAICWPDLAGSRGRLIGAPACIGGSSAGGLRFIVCSLAR